MKKKADLLYSGFIAEIKQNIITSRYHAARLANRKQLLLYLFAGKCLSEKIKIEKWGAKVLQQISVDLQAELPGLRGFSERNLKNMRQFAEAYSGPLFTYSGGVPSKKLIGQLATAQLKKPI